MPAPEGYVDVAARIGAFRAKHPDGSLQQVRLERFDFGPVSYIAFTAAAYRHPDDERPGIGTAWEQVPGSTNFTRGSELQNAETSAWGRAIVAVGAADSHERIATAQDVEWRNAEADQRAAEEAVVPGLRSSIDGAIAKLDDAAKNGLKEWFAAQNLPAVRRMNAAQCDRVLDHLLLLGEDSAGEGAGLPIDTATDAPTLAGEPEAQS